jgi:hypothetical protein
MNPISNFYITADYPGYFPDFGLLKYLIYQYTETDISRAHAAWDGICIVAIPILIIVGWLITKKILILLKRQKVKNTLALFSQRDPFWNEYKMKELSEELFNNVQYAWMKREFKTLAPWLTDKIKMEWQSTFSIMQQMNYVFVAGNIDIRRTTIISVEDHLDDNQDKFKIEISGYMKRYVKNKENNSLFIKETSELKAFTDIYSFIRSGDQWLLDDIDHKANLAKILKARNKDFHLN